MKKLKSNGQIIHSIPGFGCQKVSPGCDHCYAETQNNFRKWNGGKWGPHAPRKRTSESNWKKPLQWQRQAAEAGERRRVFCASLADVFDNKAPDGARDDLFDMIRETPSLDWLLLTKRPENIRKMLPSDWGDGYPNVWLGTTAEDQQWYNRRWSILRKIPAAVHFISYEPALGPLNIAGIGTIVLTGSSAVARAVVKLDTWIHSGLMICVISAAA